MWICRIYCCLFSDTIHCSVLPQVPRARCALVQSLLSSHEVALGIMSARSPANSAQGRTIPTRPLRKTPKKSTLRLPGAALFLFLCLQRRRKNCKEIADSLPRPARSPPETPKDKPIHQLPRQRQDKKRRKEIETIEKMETPVYELGLPIVAKALGNARLFHSLTAAV